MFFLIACPFSIAVEDMLISFHTLGSRKYHFWNFK